MQEHTKAISLLASKFSWDDVDRHLESIGFKERSKYIQYLVEKDIYKTKHNHGQTLVIVLLIILAMMSLFIILKT